MKRFSLFKFTTTEQRNSNRISSRILDFFLIPSHNEPMSESDRFFLSLKKTGKSGHSQPVRDRREEIRRAFFTHTAVLPEEMLYDIFDYYAEQHTDFEELVKALSVLVDLFNEDNDLDEDYLETEDWMYIKEVTSDFGYELEKSLLTHVMSLVMEHGGFR